MLASLSTASLSHLPLRTVFRLAAEAGFGGVELVMAPAVWLRGLRHVQGLSREHGLPILSVHQALMSWSPAGWGARRLVDATEAALALESPCVVLHVPWASRWGDPVAQEWRGALHECQRRVAGSGTRLSIENPGVYDPTDAQGLLNHLPAMIAYADRHDLGITLDTCHAGTSTIDPLASLELVGDRLLNVHLSDLSPFSPFVDIRPVRTLFVHHQMPGEGGLSLSEFLARLAANGYSVPITLELSPVALHAWSPRGLPERLSVAASCVHRATSAAPRADPARVVAGAEPADL